MMITPDESWLADKKLNLTNELKSQIAEAFEEDIFRAEKILKKSLV